MSGNSAISSFWVAISTRGYYKSRLFCMTVKRMIYLITKFDGVTRAWGGSWADCVREGLVVRKAIYHWEACEIKLVRLCEDGSIRHLERVFSCPNPVEITEDEIKAAIHAALETPGNFGYHGRNKNRKFPVDI